MKRLLILLSLLVGIGSLFAACDVPNSGETDPTDPTDPTEHTNPTEPTLRWEIDSSISWFAFKDGDAAWEVLVNRPAGTRRGQFMPITAEVTDEDRRFAYAHTCDVTLGTRRQTGIDYVYRQLGQAETFDETLWCSFDIGDPSDPAEPEEALQTDAHKTASEELELPQSFMLSGEVKGVAMNERGMVVVGGYKSDFYKLPNREELTYTRTIGHTHFPAGEYDIWAVKGGVDENERSYSASQGLVVRDVDLTDDTTRDLDFTTDGVPLTPYTVTVKNSELGSAWAGVYTSSQAELSGRETSDSFSYGAFPASVLKEDEHYMVDAIGQTENCARRIFDTFRTPQDVTLTLPDCSVVLEPSIFPEVTFTDVQDIQETQMYFGHGTLEHSARTLWHRTQYDGVWGQADSYTLPDLTGLEGWKTEWNLKPGVEAWWSAAYYAETQASSIEPGIEGGWRSQSGQREGTFTP